jgi:hypothetical protein
MGIYLRLNYIIKAIFTHYLTRQTQPYLPLEIVIENKKETPRKMNIVLFFFVSLIFQTADNNPPTNQHTHHVNQPVHQAR